MYVMYTSYNYIISVCFLCFSAFVIFLCMTCFSCLCKRDSIWNKTDRILWNKVFLYCVSCCIHQEPLLWTQRCAAVISSQWWWRTWLGRRMLSSPLVLLLLRWLETPGHHPTLYDFRRISQALTPSPSHRWGKKNPDQHVSIRKHFSTSAVFLTICIKTTFTLILTINHANNLG